MFGVRTACLSAIPSELWLLPVSATAILIPVSVVLFSAERVCLKSLIYDYIVIHLLWTHAHMIHLVEARVSVRFRAITWKLLQIPAFCMVLRAWNSLPSSVGNAPSLTTFRRELKTTFSVVVRLWLGDRDCTTQYNCRLPATTDCRRFCRFWFFCVFCLILYGGPAMSLTW